ncbi:MAG TPA: hypothetical protein PLT08_18530, partial [Anaerolineales bacterium]|nr:hypothetical protein [Anaerolineales bacterium]
RYKDAHYPLCISKFIIWGVHQIGGKESDRSHREGKANGADHARLSLKRELEQSDSSNIRFNLAAPNAERFICTLLP